MTISTVETIMKRVAVAGENSKIAVFKTITDDGIKALDSMFYTSTAIKKQREEPQNFIGAYHRLSLIHI